MMTIFLISWIEIKIPTSFANEKKNDNFDSTVKPISGRIRNNKSNFGEMPNKPLNDSTLYDKVVTNLTEEETVQQNALEPIIPIDYLKNYNRELSYYNKIITPNSSIVMPRKQNKVNARTFDYNNTTKDIEVNNIKPHLISNDNNISKQWNKQWQDIIIKAKTPKKNIDKNEYVELPLQGVDLLKNYINERDENRNKSVINSRGISSGANTKNVNIIFGNVDDENIVTNKSISILKNAASRIGLKDLTITETIRKPISQAKIMFNNLKAGNDLSYKPPGEAVESLYYKLKKQGCSDSNILDSMAYLITDYSKGNNLVSKHCVDKNQYDKLNVIDISIKNMDMKEMINELLKDDNVVKILHGDMSIPNQGNRLVKIKNEPCLHVEIKQ